jgi:hypothetical protein
MSFFSLHDVLCVEVMSKWCELKEIGSLDSAVCNSEYRPGFLTNFSDKKLDLGAGLNDRFMKWVVLRFVKPTSFVMYESCVFSSWREAIDWSEVLEITIFNKTLSPVQDTNLVNIVNDCEKLLSMKFTPHFYIPSDENDGHVFSIFSNKILARLTHISLAYDDDFVLDPLLVHLTEKCHELRSLEIHCCYIDDFTESVVLNLIKSNPHLKTIDLRVAENENELFSNDFLPCLVSHCSNLSSLHLHLICDINLSFITQTITDDFITGRYEMIDICCIDFSTDNMEKLVFSLKNGVRSVEFDNVTGQFSVTDTDMLDFFSRIVNLHNITMLNWVAVTDDMLVMLARASPDLRSLKFGDCGYFRYFCDDDDDRSYVGLQQVVESCRELRVLSLEFITTSLCEQILTVLTTPNTITFLSLTHEDSQTATVSGFLVKILQANLQLTTLRVYKWPCVETTCVKTYLLETGRVLEFITAGHPDNDN